MLNTLILLLSLSPLTAIAARGIAGIRHNIRVGHAKELMGSHYKRSVVSRAEKHKGMEANILATLKARLPKAYRSKAHAISNAIIKEATKHNLDPYFVMAVVSGESSFNPEAIGPVGEIGLMQIRPSTGKWMAELVKSKWKGDKTLRDPLENIKLGTAYLAWLREKFAGQGQLYLAAYNMGATSVRRALDKKIWPKDYPRHVMKRYVAFYRDINATL